MSLILDGTNGLSDVDGSASTPAIRGTDTNTGIFFPAADTIAFAEGGTEVARFDSSGNLGIGTSSPIAKLDVVGSAGVTSFTGTTRLGVTVRGSNSTTDYSGIDFTGTSVNGPTARIAVLSGASGSSLQFGTSNAYASGITNTAMTLDSSGNLLVGTTSAGIANTLSTTIETSAANNSRITVNHSSVAGSSNDSNYMQFGYGGNLIGRIVQASTTTVSYTTSSDYRLKENIAPMLDALAKVALLKPVTYRWKSNQQDTQGFIAHELQEVIPECVVGEKDAVDEEGNPQYQGIDTSFLVATLTAAIQEQQAIITDLKSRIEALEVK